MPCTSPRATDDGNESVVRRHRRDGTHRIYLVPGFLGFANLGRITYFGHVRRIWRRAWPRSRSTRAFMSCTRNRPRRCPHARRGWPRRSPQRPGGGNGPIHLIGHSSGGLDVRLLTAPGVALPTRVDVERLATRVRTVVTLSTPHYGTPLASFFTTLQGTAAAAAPCTRYHLRVAVRTPPAVRAAVDGEHRRALRRPHREQRAAR